MRPIRGRGYMSRSAHQNSVRVMRKMGVEPVRPHADHPSVVRVLYSFGRQQRSCDAALRRLPDLFQETRPESVGTISGRWDYQRRDQHRCKSLGSATVNGTGLTVVICKYHRRCQPTQGTVGAAWLHWILPATYARWKREAHDCSTVGQWNRPGPERRKRQQEENATIQPYMRLKVFIAEIHGRTE